ncbi:MAG: restriction endonuclease [Boseongicola sp. SB0675_bin_26]|nr:restriction endonuclease [Boseongicola sp. SB0675_bin_26]
MKFTSRSTWHGTGNSIFEGMRDEAASHVYLVYFRSDIPEARWSRYENCIKGVRISHSPRYMIDMDGGGNFFRDLDLTLEAFKDLDMKDKMVLVKEDVQKRLKEGERLWWFGDDQDHTIPVNVRLYRNLDTSRQSALRAEAALMCPEIFQGSRKRSKYDGIAVYLLTQHGVLASNVRDMFSAGSVAGPERGGDYILRSVKNNIKAIRKAAAELDDALFVEYWGESCLPENRMTRWFELIDAAKPTDPPSAHLRED